MNDDELERRAASALRECFPEPTGSQPRLPDERLHHGPRIAAVGGGVGVVLAAGLTIGLIEATSGTGPSALHTTGPTSAAPTVATSTGVSIASSPAPPALPQWARRCRPRKADRLAPAPEYLGLTFRQAERLARRRGEELVLAGSGGKCDHSSDGVYRTDNVALVFDVHFFRKHPNGQRDPRNPRARIIAADHVPGGWSGANR
jgi:hypothetical protein